MLLPPPGGLRAPRIWSLFSAFPSANMLFPANSLSLALLEVFSCDPAGTSPLKILLPVSSANFCSCIFLDVFLTASSPNKKFLWTPPPYNNKQTRVRK